MNTLKTYQPNETYDSTKGFHIGSILYLANEQWICTDATMGNAKWDNNGVVPFNREGLIKLTEITKEDLNSVTLNDTEFSIIIENGKFENAILQEIIYIVTEDFENDIYYGAPNYISETSHSISVDNKLQNIGNSIPHLGLADIILALTLNSPCKQNWTKGKIDVFGLFKFLQ